jgi:hypothetical protein
LREKGCTGGGAREPIHGSLLSFSTVRKGESLLYTVISGPEGPFPLSGSREREVRLQTGGQVLREARLYTIPSIPETDVEISLGWIVRNRVHIL